MSKNLKNEKKKKNFFYCCCLNYLITSYISLILLLKII